MARRSLGEQQNSIIIIISAILVIVQFSVDTSVGKITQRWVKLQLHKWEALTPPPPTPRKTVSWA